MDLNVRYSDIYNARITNPRQLGSGSDKYYEPSLMEMIIHSQTRQNVSLAYGLESAMISIASYGNRAKTVMQVAKATNYAGAAFGIADNYLNAKLATEQGNTIRAYFEYSQMVLYGVGAGMLRNNRLAPVGDALIFGLGLIDLGQYWYDNN
jgi:hypothetical protein